MEGRERGGRRGGGRKGGYGAGHLLLPGGCTSGPEAFDVGKYSKSYKYILVVYFSFSLTPLKCLEDAFSFVGSRSGCRVSIENLSMLRAWTFLTFSLALKLFFAVVGMAEALFCTRRRGGEGYAVSALA